MTLAVIAGFLAGSLRAGLHGKALQPPPIVHSWLIFAALVPQILTFQVPNISQTIPLFWAKGILIGSLICLLIVVWLNRNLSGLTLLGFGLVLNLIVIVVNGGLMPISPTLATYVHPETASHEWLLGERLGLGKDVVLQPTETRLEFLSDRFRFPDFIPYRVAYSLGDIFIAIGTFTLLWRAGKISPAAQNEPSAPLA